MNQDPSELPESTSRLETIGQLRALLVDVMPDAETMWRVSTEAPRGWAGRLMRRAQPTEAPPTFRGHLAMDADQAYSTLKERFATLGYTPILRRHGDHDMVIALARVFPDGTQGRKGGRGRSSPHPAPANEFVGPQTNEGRWPLEGTLDLSVRPEPCRPPISLGRESRDGGRQHLCGPDPRPALVYDVGRGE